MLRKLQTYRRLTFTALVTLNLNALPAAAHAGSMPPYQNFVFAQQYVQSLSARVQMLIYRSQGGQGGHPGGGWGEGRPGGHPGGGWGEGQPGGHPGGGWGEGQPGGHPGGGWGMRWPVGGQGHNGFYAPRFSRSLARSADDVALANNLDNAEVSDSESAEPTVAASDVAEVSESPDLAGENVNDEVAENDHLANLALQVMGQKLFHLGQMIEQTRQSYGTPVFWGRWQSVCAKTNDLLFANQGAKVAASLPIQGYVTPADFAPNDFELQAIKQQLWCR